MCIAMVSLASVVLGVQGYSSIPLTVTLVSAPHRESMPIHLCTYKVTLF